MRSHSQIVRDFGATALANGLKERGLDIGQSTVQRWADRNSVPGEYWDALATMQVAQLDELAAAASKLRPAQNEAVA